MPLATANEVITQVPWSGEAPRLPEMVGMATLAMVVSSTCMKVPSASAIDASAFVAGGSDDWLELISEIYRSPRVGRETAISRDRYRDQWLDTRRKAGATRTNGFLKSLP